MQANNQFPIEYIFNHDYFLLLNCEGFAARHGFYVQQYGAGIIRNLRNQTRQIVFNFFTVLHSDEVCEFRIVRGVREIVTIPNPNPE